MTMTQRCLVLWLFAGILALSQSKDPLVGTWMVDRGKSDFDPPSNFFQPTMIVEPRENGLSVVTITINDRRQTSQTAFTAKYDGKDAAIENSILDTVALKRIDAQTVERIGKLRGQVVEKATWKMSADGKVLIITTTGSAEGQEYTSTQHFDRQ